MDQATPIGQIEKLLPKFSERGVGLTNQREANIVALFVRIYRTEALLRFYFDQGRDALVIWRLLHEGKFFLIGPVTGLDGIFLGPFYYYLIAPLYLLGGGSPVAPAVFLGYKKNSFARQSFSLPQSKN